MSVPGGVCAAVLTPVTRAYQPDAPKALEYYGELLESGCNALNVLGTTGEAMSLSTGQRLQFLESLVSGGFAREKAMAGTGSAALADAIAMTRGALDAGFAGCLIMPPFFYRHAGDDAIVRFFTALLAAVPPPPRSIYLYHFPQVSGIAFTPALVGRLMREFPGIVAGIKDSANDLPFEEALNAQFPELDVFPSSESHVLFARRTGLAGCISGSVALWPSRARRIWDNDVRDPDAAQEELSTLRAGVEGPDIIRNVRKRVAQASGDASWLTAVPPL